MHLCPTLNGEKQTGRKEKKKDMKENEQRKRGMMVRVEGSSRV